VQAGEHELDTGQTGLRVHTGRNAAAVVVHLDAAVCVQSHNDPGGKPGDALVGRVVDDLGEQVIDATAVGGPDVHAGSFADGLEPFEVR
jgi:hypothetical protein